MQRTTFLRLAAATALAASVSPLAFSQGTGFPRRAVTIVVPAAPGGAIDLAARVMGQKLSEIWGQPVTIDNKAGASGILGTDVVAKAAPDGHTLALVSVSHSINPALMKKLPFDTLTGFEPVVLTHVVPLVLVVNLQVPVKTTQELIAYARANPGKLSFASSGTGTALYMSGELFRGMASLDMIHIPYKSSVLAHPDLLSGRTTLMFDTLAAISPHIKSGQVRALGITTARRSGALPDVPTMQEAGLAGYDTSTWGGILAPAGTPKETVTKINADFNKVMAMPDVRERLQNAGMEVGGGSSAQFSDFVRTEMIRWQKVATAAGLQPE